MFLQVPCGTCSECRKQKYNEWFFRAYYESSSCINKGGFVLFDTLTYRDKCLPHLHNHFKGIPSEYDYPCFNRKDTRYFFVRLRRSLERDGYNVSGNLKYFLSSEYGTDSNATHRPHYHVLFYSLIPNLDHLTLSRYISKCWRFGRTDGVAYKGALYTTEHTFSKSDPLDLQYICKYVTKYVMKDSQFDQEINARIVNICSYKGLDPLSFDGRKFVRDVRRVAAQYHLQSHGFGEDFLQYNDYNTVVNDGIIICPDSISTRKSIPLPVYYRRKLFYDVVKDFRGMRCWRLNELGKVMKYRQVEQSLEILNQRFQTWYNNLHLYVDANRIQSITDTINTYLDGRDFRHFSIYIGLFRGTIKSELTFVSTPPLDYWLPAIYEGTESSSKYYYNYSNMYDRHYFERSFISDVYLGDSTNGYNDIPFHDDMDLNDFCRKFVVNEDSYPVFHDFDKLWELYCLSLSGYSESKDALFNHIERLKKLYKSIN